MPRDQTWEAESHGEERQVGQGVQGSKTGPFPWAHLCNPPQKGGLLGMVTCTWDALGTWTGGKAVPTKCP